MPPGNLQGIRQGEGCEPGDALAPAHFAGQHESFAGAPAVLHGFGLSSTDPARCGHHCFDDGRPGTVTLKFIPGQATCRLCESGCDSFKHCLSHCTAHHMLQEWWGRRSSHTSAMTLHTLFSTSPDVNSARGITSHSKRLLNFA